MEIFRCKSCPHAGPKEDFAADKYGPRECKKCKNARSRKHYGENKERYAVRGPRRRFEARAIVNRIKQNGRCADCKEKFHYCQMDFDHRDRSTKKKQVSYMLMNGIETIMKEIAKCDLVCANCHRDRTQRQVASLPVIIPKTSSGVLLRQRSAFVNSLKDGKDCADCCSPHPYWRLDFDHRDRSKKTMTISKMKLAKYSEKKILEEMEKCDIVCARCHRMRTFRQQRMRRSGPT
jgi:hypothetical protein